MNQLNYLGRRFVWDEKFFADYKAFIEVMISKGYAKQSKKAAPVGKSWYIPHHDVYHRKISQERSGWCLIVVLNLKGSQSTMS